MCCVLVYLFKTQNNYISVTKGVLEPNLCPVGFLQYWLKICTHVLLVTVSVFLSLNFFLVSCNFSLWFSTFRYIQIISVMIPWHIHRCCRKLHFCFEFLHPSFPLKRIKHGGDGLKAFKEFYDFTSWAGLWMATSL